MCTTARLVQGAQESAWFGMPMGNAPPPAANVRLEAGQPAYLEVSIDPAAHGPNALGRIMRGVMLETAGGQELQFELAANVVR